MQFKSKPNKAFHVLEQSPQIFNVTCKTDIQHYKNLNVEHLFNTYQACKKIWTVMKRINQPLEINLKITQVMELLDKTVS